MIQKMLVMLIACVGLWFNSLAMLPTDAKHQYGDHAVPIYFQENTNFPMLAFRQDWAQYLDRTSIVVKQSSDTDYMIAANVFLVFNAHQPSAKVEKYHTVTFYYDLKQHKMFEKDDNAVSGWRNIHPRNSNAYTQFSIEPGEALFYIVTGKTIFKGSWFRDNFYKRF